MTDALPLQAERAEREEVQLRLQLTNMRDELGKCLHALGGLERNVHDLCADKLEMRGALTEPGIAA